MRRSTLLVVLTAAGSGVCWWPVIIQPNLDLPFWKTPLILVALVTGLGATLADEGHLKLMVVPILGTFVGICSGFMLWWPADGIGASFVPLVVGTATLASVPVSIGAVIAGVALHGLSASRESRRRAVFCAFLACVAFGPLMLSITPLVVAVRVRRNDELAARRFRSLVVATEGAAAAGGGSSPICDGSALKRHYSGPAFSESDWRYIGGNAVNRDGYSFTIICGQGRRYAIRASPAREKGDGTRRFCADESGILACRPGGSHP